MPPVPGRLEPPQLVPAATWTRRSWRSRASRKC